MRAPQVVYEFEGTEGEISGIKVMMAFRGGVFEAVEVASIKDALKLSSNDPFWHFLTSKQFTGKVTVHGKTGYTNLVWLESFIHFCQRNPSPKLDAFHGQLTRTATQIQRRGSWIDPQAGPAAFIPEGMEDNQIVQMAAMVISQQQQMARIGREVEAVKGDVALLKGRMHQLGNDWPVAVWLKHHGHPAGQEFCNQEGRALRAICNQYGIAVKSEKLCNGSQWPCRVWPLSAIKIWWPECCERNGWPLEWMVDIP